MGPKAPVLVWRRYHANGRLCPRATGKSRLAFMALAGERKSVLGSCGCSPNPGSYYQADDPTAAVAVDGSQESPGASQSSAAPAESAGPDHPGSPDPARESS